MFHLAENTVGNIVVTAPVCRTFGVGELVHIMAIQLTLQHFGGRVNFACALYEMAAATVKFNLLYFPFGGAGGHDGNKR